MVGVGGNIARGVKQYIAEARVDLRHLETAKELRSA